MFFLVCLFLFPVVLANDVVPNPKDYSIFFTQSLRGRPAIIANGVRFLILSESKYRILWRCSAMAAKKVKCPARITMLKETPPKFIINIAEHIHAIKPNKGNASKEHVYSEVKVKDEPIDYDSDNIVTTATTTRGNH